MTKMDRQIVQTLLDTKAVNFEALGKAIAQFGAASIMDDDDGWIRWCGNDMRIYRWPRQFDLEDLVALREIVVELNQFKNVIAGKVQQGG
jgi:hypothetical protein